MIDRARIYVKAGDGGNGVVSFRREKFVPFGGPDGGKGGNGGSVYLVGSGSLSTLQGFRYQRSFRAQGGVHGKGKDMVGKRGKDLMVGVPLGTVVRRSEQDGSEVLIADIVKDGERVLVAGGGKGGFGNAHFATSTNQAPRIAEQGEAGEEAWLTLDLKLIADVGIAGYPNAGKSTLLSAVSGARPKIADYPFTTIEPVLGVVDLGYQSFVLADIPGIIEGAHQGVGLGHEFLRHIERTKVLIHLVDGTSATPVQDLKNVELELERYEATLKDKPRIVAVNKIDLVEVRERLPEIRRELQGITGGVHFISAATREGVNELMSRAAELLAQTAAATAKEVESPDLKVFRPRPLPAAKSRGEEHDKAEGRGPGRHV